MNRLLISYLPVVAVSVFAADQIESRPDDPFFAKFNPAKAPRATGILKKGDRLAICGDSITGQKMYSRIIETYLAVCAPELEATAALTDKVRAPLAAAIRQAFVPVTHVIRIAPD